MNQRHSGKRKQKKSARQELIEELTGMIKDVDEEGLIFLIEQANVLLYNMRVNKINRRIAQASGEKREKGKGARPREPGIDIEESEDGAFFYIIVNLKRIFFTLEEMRKLVRLCHAADDNNDASRRLYNWFSRNRKDFLIDGEIESSRNPALAHLYERIVRTYKVKQG